MDRETNRNYVVKTEDHSSQFSSAFLTAFGSAMGWSPKYWVTFIHARYRGGHRAVFLSCYSLLSISVIKQVVQISINLDLNI